MGLCRRHWKALFLLSLRIAFGSKMLLYFQLQMLTRSLDNFPLISYWNCYLNYVCPRDMMKYELEVLLQILSADSDWPNRGIKNENVTWRFVHPNFECIFSPPKCFSFQAPLVISAELPIFYLIFCFEFKITTGARTFMLTPNEIDLA